MHDRQIILLFNIIFMDDINVGPLSGPRSTMDQFGTAPSQTQPIKQILHT